VLKETLLNIVKHAEAKRVLVSLRYGNETVDMSVQDDGVGIGEVVWRTYGEDCTHYGLRHMRQQILDVRGTFEVANGDEGGTTVRVTVPLS